jgi:hypothetical protein
MSTSIIKNWYKLAVYIASLFAVALAVGEWNFTQMILLGAMIFIQLHFFEEFGFPGGFPWVGMKVEMRMVENDPKKWPLNNASAFWGNQWFAGAVYLSAFLLPQLRFLTLAVIMFAFLELLGHLFIFNIALKDWYNPGLFTALFGLAPLSIMYLTKVDIAATYSWLDAGIAFAWIVFNYWLAFRSPIYKALGRKAEYAFSVEEVDRASRYIKKQNR